MLLKFLRLFNAFRQLEELATLYHKQCGELIEEQRISFSAIMRAEIAEQDRDRARTELSHALKMVANFQAVQAGAIRVPFPDADATILKPDIEDAANPKQPERLLMRDVQRRAVAHSRREAYDKARLANLTEG